MAAIAMNFFAVEIVEVFMYVVPAEIVILLLDVVLSKYSLYSYVLLVYNKNRYFDLTNIPTSNDFKHHISNTARESS